MVITVMPAALSAERVVIDGAATTDELIDFIIKYEALAQMVTVQLDLSSRRTKELTQQLYDARDVIEAGYGKLRGHLGDKATRQRHTS